MQTASRDSLDGALSPSPASSRFEVSLIYQDLPTGLRARQFLNHLLDSCQMAAEFSLTLWKLDLFHLPEVCEQAVLSACKAGLVLLSLRGDLGLDVSTENWLAEWIDRRGDEEGALAVLIDTDMQRLDSVGQTLFWLQQITRPSQVRLFVGFTPSAAAANDAPAWKLASPDTEMLFVRDTIASPAELHHGGINE